MNLGDTPIGSTGLKGDLDALIYEFVRREYAL